MMRSPDSVEQRWWVEPAVQTETIHQEDLALEEEGALLVVASPVLCRIDGSVRPRKTAIFEKPRWDGR